MSDSTYKYLLILSMILWGGGWSALKVLTPELSMEVIVFWRFFIMSLSFLPILLFFNRPIILNRSNLKYILSSSVLNIAFMVSSFFGIKYGLAGGGGVIITTLTPIMTFLLVAIIFRKHLQKFQYIGITLGLIGATIMLQITDINLFLNGSNIYFLLCAIIWAGVTLLSQYSHSHIHPIHYSFIISFIATIVTLLFGLFSDVNLLSVFEQDSRFWIALIYLSVFGQTIATTIYFMVSGKLGSEVTSSYMFLVPIFALVIAWLVLDEAMQFHIIVGGMISLLAVYFINKN
ncbi:MAG: DMT family transporter [Campylobacterota bacterium]|nr:DMT family transporter [Campylobacterota bacterium]